MRINRSVSLFGIIVVLLAFAAGTVSAQFLPWSPWHIATTGNISDQYGKSMSQFTMTSILNFDNGMCVVVLRDTTTGQFAMIEAPGTGNCNE
jgi:hypothetical protein